MLTDLPLTLLVESMLAQETLTLRTMRMLHIAGRRWHCYERKAVGSLNSVAVYDNVKRGVDKLLKLLQPR